MKHLHKEILMGVGLLVLLVIGLFLVFGGSETFIQMFTTVKHSMPTISAPKITESNLDMFFKYAEKFIGFGMSVVALLTGFKSLKKKRRTVAPKEEQPEQPKSTKSKVKSSRRK